MTISNSHGLNWDSTINYFLSMDEHSGPLTGEQLLWVEVIRQAISDALNNPKDKHGDKCYLCHDSWSCEHREYVDHHKRLGYWRHKQDCPVKGKTVGQCARDWIAGQGFEGVCSMVGLEADYIRRKMASCRTTDRGVTCE